MSCLLLPVTLFAQLQAYEMEAGTLLNGATVQDCGACSGGKLVGYLGGSENGGVRHELEAEKAGEYTLILYYASGDPRAIALTINDEEPAELACPSTGGWGTLGALRVPIQLQEGTNVLTFDNPAGWAPNLDGFSLSPVYPAPVYEAEAGVRAGGAAVQACSACSGGSQVGNLGGASKGSVTHQVQVAEAGDYYLVLYYTSGDPRSIWITVNEQAPVEVPCAASGGWSMVGATRLTVALQAGTNTLVFDNATGWGPNLDAFVVQAVPRYTLSGYLNQGGAPVAGATLTLQGGVEATTVTDENGFYAFDELPAERSFTLAPSAPGKVFQPLYRTYNALDGDQAEQNFTAEARCEDCQHTFAFGQGQRLVYDTQTGTYSLFVEERAVLKDAQAIVHQGDAAHSSLDYTERQLTTESISDAVGNGQKITVSMTSEGLPALQQLFYVYQNNPAFFTELVLAGPQVSSNYMAPLVTHQVDLGVEGDTRMLFVPFDNDAWVRYDAKPAVGNATNVSAEVSAFYENNSRHGLVVGSVEHEVWKTGIRTKGSARLLSELTVWGGYTDPRVTRDVLPHNTLSGTQVKSPKIMVGFFDDWRAGMEAYARANAAAEPRYLTDWKRPTPFSWNSWGSLQTRLNLESAKAVASFFASSLPAFRSDSTVYIDLDSYWDNMVSGGLEGDFTQLIAFVKHCKALGLKPGIYWAPFVDWGNSDRRVEGSTYTYAEAWTKINGTYHTLDGARAMDPTHPATQRRMALLIDKFKRCGFEMLKVDFITHASLEADDYYDPNVQTGMQAFRQGMEYLIDQIDGKMLVYVAISPNLATGRYAHVRRIACDAYADINETEYTLNSTTYGWWQTYLYDYIDADHLVFGNEPLGENRARLTSGLITGTLTVGDDYSTRGPWVERAQQLLQKPELLALAQEGKAFRPVEGNSGAQAAHLFVRTSGTDTYVALVNYQEARSYTLALARLGIPPGKYEVNELFTGEISTLEGEALQVEAGAQDAYLFRLTPQFVNSTADDLPPDTAMLYPNPATHRVTLKNEKGISACKVYSLKGKLLFEADQLHRDRFELDLSSFARGVYFVACTDATGVISHYKLVKQ
ncbi:CBM35 domain-containing protein [Catalinimonas alkaloidigena]|uniref:CBM35 domain-containing protein n=1 Tax=Catalinimonas alkaloidigena TaxID=1075417 RepID=UPI001C40A650|nr:CBM35 domain-containing protein [Catalinimonas alkaloidigena]